MQWMPVIKIMSFIALLSSYPLEEVHVGKLFHLLDVPFGLDNLLVIEEHPSLLIALHRKSLSYERNIMPIIGYVISDSWLNNW